VAHRAVAADSCFRVATRLPFNSAASKLAAIYAPCDLLFRGLHVRHPFFDFNWFAAGFRRSKLLLALPEVRR
jgi:hypothetical protein